MCLKIEETGNGRIVVALSDEDMHELDITYDEMDYSNIETRRVIWTVLDKAKQSIGTPINTDGRLLIEVSPAKDGGCTMYFTVMPAPAGTNIKKPVMKKGGEPLLFCTDDCSALIEAYKRLEREYEKIEYAESRRFNGRYYFVIYPKALQSTYLTYILSDYGTADENGGAFALNVHELGEGKILFK